VPHFEKMLYDNALLLVNLANAYALTGRKVYKDVIGETIGFLQRELMHPETAGFFSALDADSEGEEGRFYVWSEAEFANLLKEKALLMGEYFDITGKGNWEGKNIPRLKLLPEEFARKKGLDVKELEEMVSESKGVLLEAREKRVRPGFDDKILLGWNALANRALSRAFAATGQEAYRELAVRNMKFVLEAFKGPDGRYHHSWKEGRARHPAFLDDYAYLVAALIELAQVTADYEYFDIARDLTVLVEEGFSDEEGLLFYFTHKGQLDIPVRKKEIYDGATPSGNSVMAYNLYRLSIVFDVQAWRRRAEKMTGIMLSGIIKFPTSFGVWLSLLYEMIQGTAEIVIVGKDWKFYIEKMFRMYISHKLALATDKPLPKYPLLADKAETKEILFYLCKNYACRQPVNTLQEFQSLLSRK